MLRSVLICCLLAPVAVQAAGTAEFFPDPSAGVVYCDGIPAQLSGPNQDALPFTCKFPDTEKLHIVMESWGGWSPEATITRDSRTVIGFCSGAMNPNKDVLNTYHPSPLCAPLPNEQTQPPPAATGDKLVDEWYTDLPWTQKLSTYTSNEINVPFVLPYAALPNAFRSCAEDDKDCMARTILRYGIVNVMGLHRTDTLYDDGEALSTADCKGKECVEVKLDIQRFNTQTNDSKGYEADVVSNNGATYYDNSSHAIPSLGFALTEATIFAPGRPWYTGHYCAGDSDSTRDAICYDDYFTTQLIASTPVNKNWLRDAPAFFWPRDTSIPAAGFTKDFCTTGATKCSMYLGKVDWLPDATAPEVVACDVPPPPDSLEACVQQVTAGTERLDGLFNESINAFVDVGRYPWGEPEIANLGADNRYNPYIGFYQLERSEKNADDGVFRFKSPHYVLPKRCTKADYQSARQGNASAIEKLSECALDFEIHTSGYHEIWKELYGGLPLSESTIIDIGKAFNYGLDANQYGRTMFLLAGIPEQHVPVSSKVQDDDSLSIYDKVYNGSIYIQYLPLVNPADLTLTTKGAPSGKNYNDVYWHAFFMSNHMNQTPDHFIRGIRGRTLWHNEYRSSLMYKSYILEQNKGTQFEGNLGHVDFPAGFQTNGNTLAPFHGNTCDACHVRNGSGIPLMPNGQLPEILVDQGMRANYHVETDDYTYTNQAYTSQEVPAMKLVFFDLGDPTRGNDQYCDDDNETVPVETDMIPVDEPTHLYGQPNDSHRNRLYSNKIMNFYGNSLPLSQSGKKLEYTMKYVDICDEKADGYEIVDDAVRSPAADNQYSTCGPDKTTNKWPRYQPKWVSIDTKNMANVCTTIADWEEEPPSVWPDNCEQVNGEAIMAAITSGKIGYMHLLGRRLGNTPLIEMIPNQTIEDIHAQQKKDHIPSCISLAPGTRSGANYRDCSSGKLGIQTDDCYIGRWGWIGDRASLEDQIANAAHVEMNISSTEGYGQIHPDADSNGQLVRYHTTLCGPANADCRSLATNSDITEQEISDMATYQRWIGIPNRSEYQVSSDKVTKGEKIFMDLQCNSCHVIRKIPFVYGDNMLPDEERDHLEKLAIPNGGTTNLDYPFVSYLGTDLLLHDMGYLSQVAKSPEGVEIRDKASGRVKPHYRPYVQYIRTPALKGLRFNRFVTDSNHNTQDASDPLIQGFTPGCDFLLHDGRACDAIEAAYLHDGPAVKELHMIENLNNLDSDQLLQLRAFLYSL